MPNLPRGWLLGACLFATWVIWGSTYLGIKLALVSLPPFLLSGVRYLVAGALMLAISRWRRESAPTLRQTLNAAAGGGLALAIGNGAVCVAEQYSASGLVALVMAATPLLTVVLNQLLGVRARSIEWLAVVLGVVGVGLIQLHGDISGSVLATTIMLGGALAWAVASVMLPRLAMPAPMASCAIQMLGGGTISLLFGVIMRERVYGLPGLTASFAMLYLILAGSLCGYSAYLWLLRHTRAALATSFFCINPIVALLLGCLFSGETITPTVLLGSGIVIGAVALVLFAERGRRSPAIT